MHKNMKHSIDVAMGRKKGDLLLKNAKVICTFTEEVIDADILIANGYIVSLCGGEADHIIHVNGRFVAPSFIDAHIHIESSMLTPKNFSHVVVPHGTGAIITDPHEIYNVQDRAGFDFMMHDSENVDMNIFFTIPSCVPATLLETSGGKIDVEALENILQQYGKKRIVGLSEMMNYPGVCLNIENVIQELEWAEKHRFIRDGHAPLVRGKELNAYLNAGIQSDHECSSVEEALEKLRLGMWIFIRDGSAARNLDNLVPLIKNNTVHRICICSDDRHPEELLEKGHLDYTLQRLCAHGIDLPRAIRLMTLNPSTFYQLPNLGAIAPGYAANFILFSDWNHFQVEEVYFQGKKVAENGKRMAENDAYSPYTEQKQFIKSTIMLPSNIKERFQQYPTTGQIRSIVVRDGELLTDCKILDIQDMEKQDVAYMAVLTRHATSQSQNIGLGFVSGFQLKNGALASTVAHDSHNLIVIGSDIPNMLTAIEQIQEIQGGLCVIQNNKTLATLPLPIAGLMSDKNAEQVVQEKKILEHATQQICTGVKNAFMMMSFLALPVIPHWKLTDKGLVHVDTQEIDVKNSF
ncbi:MAG: adenine deaminase [Planctomycetes bacterium]|jgi:adenine deaminase|nr:adenine deaminase [Planctomycetota bacterium]